MQGFHGCENAGMDKRELLSKYYAKRHNGAWYRGAARALIAEIRRAA